MCGGMGITLVGQAPMAAACALSPGPLQCSVAHVTAEQKGVAAVALLLTGGDRKWDQGTEEGT